jgi:demethylmenaquinone methyltransferase/2-methoxy-6-polyprenyl-1,4-benzoquinol methylase
MAQDRSDQMRDILERPMLLFWMLHAGRAILRWNYDAEPKLVIRTDFCRPMLAVAQQKEAEMGVPYIEADALCLPFGDGTFDALTIAFGLRNLADVRGGLSELLRVLKPSGRCLFSNFQIPWCQDSGSSFNLYFSRILPFIGGLVSGSRGAYEYLPDSVSKFPRQLELAAMMESVGFAK